MSISRAPARHLLLLRGERHPSRPICSQASGVRVCACLCVCVCVPDMQVRGFRFRPQPSFLSQTVNPGPWGVKRKPETPSAKF